MVLEEVSNPIIEQTAKNVEASAGIMKQTIDELAKWLIGKSGSVLLAFLFIVVGLRVVGIVVKMLRKSPLLSSIEESVVGFLLSFIKIVGYILVFIMAAAIIGIEVTSFVTLLGTASLAIGLALQGALSNLAGGVLILILKPFQVDDYIIEDNSKNEGTVISIDIFYTRLRTHDNRVVVIPNGILTNNSLTNLTKETKRKMEVKIAISYKSDIKKVKENVYTILSAESRILEDEPKDVFIDSFDESGMTLGIRAWVKTEDFWSTTWDLREAVKEAFDENEIKIPYNRVEVDMVERNENL